MASQHQCAHEPKVATIKVQGNDNEFSVIVCKECKKDPDFKNCEVQEI